MGVYIPNMEKPKNCDDCLFQMIDGDFERNEWLTIESCLIKDDEADDCPLIEIDLVRCGECKHMRKYALRSDEPTGIWCHRWSVPRLVTDDDFCSYGERRTE